MRVLRVLDTRSHLLQQPSMLAYGSRAAAAAGSAVRVSSSSLDGWGSQGSLAGPLSRSSSGILAQQQQQQQVMSRSSSTASLVGKAAAGQQQHGATAAAAAARFTQGSSMQGTAGVAGRVTAGDKHPMLRKLAAYLMSPQQQQTRSSACSLQTSGLSSSSSGSSSAVVNILSPSVDIQVQLQGFGISLVSDTRELLYGCCRGLNARFSQDAVRRAVGFSIGSIRVENTLYGCQYPLLLASPVSRSVFGVVVHSPAGLAGKPDAAAAAMDAAAGGSVGMQQAAVDADRSSTEGADSAAQQDAAAAVAANEVASEAAAAAVTDSPATAAAEGASQAAAAATAAFAAAAQLLQQQQLTEQQQQQPPVLLPHQLALGVLATVWRTQPSGVICVEQLGVQVSPCALSLEGKHLKQLVDFVQSMQAATADAAAGSYHPLPASSRRHRSSSSRALAQLNPPAAAAAAAPVLPPSLPSVTAGHHGLKLYFEQWQMSAITLCVSFAPDSWFDPLPGAAAAAAGAATSKDLDSGSSNIGSAGAVLAGLAAAPDDSSAGAAAASASAAAAELLKSSASISSSNTLQDQEAAEAANTSKLDTSTSSNSSSAHDALTGRHSSSSSSSIAVSPLPVWLQMALALAHAEEGAWLTLGAFERSHTMINTDSLVQVRMLWLLFASCLQAVCKLCALY
jgi:hypothetical protein